MTDRAKRRPRDTNETHTPGGRPRCQGHYKRTGPGEGRQCPHPALPGLTVCKRHGGATPQAQAKSLRYTQQETLMKSIRRFGARRDIDPATALLEVVQHAAGDVAWLRERITELVGDAEGENVQSLLWAVTRAETSSEDAVDLSTGNLVAGPTKYTQTLEPHPLYVMYEKASDRLMKASTAALAAGIAERHVALAESQGLMVAQAIRGVLGAMLAELNERGLSPVLAEEWEGLVGQIVPSHLRALALTSGQEAQQ